MFLALSFTARAADAPAPDETTAAITTLREGLIDSFNKGDIDKLVSYVAPDAVITWQNGEVCKGPEELKAFYQRMMTGDGRIVREVQCQPEVIGRHVYGDWAVSWGNMHDHFVLMDGRNLQLNSVFTATIARRDGRWMVVAFHTSVDAFENPVMKIAIQKMGMWIGFAGLAGGLIFGIVGMRMFGGKKEKAAGE